MDKEEISAKVLSIISGSLMHVNQSGNSKEDITGRLSDLDLGSSYEGAYLGNTLQVTVDGILVSVSVDVKVELETE